MEKLLCGTWTLTQGFHGIHNEVFDTCKKYEQEMLELEDDEYLKKELTIHKIILKNPDREVEEYILNEGQIFFLILLLENSEQILDLKVKLILEYSERKNMLRALTGEEGFNFIDSFFKDRGIVFDKQLSLIE